MERVEALRSLFKEHKIEAYIIPNTDEFQSEYLAPYAERLAFLTGFTGSAGTAIITKNKAAFFTDGRYTLQASKELCTDTFEIFNISQKDADEWIKNNVKGFLGIDPWLFTINEVENFEKAGIKIKTLDENLIDTIWGEAQPNRPKDRVEVHPIEFAGMDHLEKCKEIGIVLSSHNIDRFLLTRPDSISWLFNIRGDDIPYNPTVLSYAAINADGTYDLFIDLEKMNGKSFSHLETGGRIIDINMMEHHLASTKNGHSRIGLDQRSTPYAIKQMLDKQKLECIHMDDPCQLPKAIKNDTEIMGTREAHIRDGAALVKFLSWLDGMPLEGELDEFGAAQKLYEFRKTGKNFHDLSFTTIAGFGPNGAIIHYRAAKNSCSKLKRDSLFLLDSGGQYLDGTTDVTRTISLGSPTEGQIENFTRVLKGHIGIATAKFPKGTTGGNLDVLARIHLWKAGLDYDHGTGHGVGSFLCVHEGPQSISRKNFQTPLEPGMLLSNEPGYYKTGEYGIRIESVVVIKDSKYPGFLEFDTLTMVPIDLKLVDIKMLTYLEKKWLNEYHSLVYETISPMLDKLEKDWLALNTRAV